jgi:hypothetical protein
MKLPKNVKKTPAFSLPRHKSSTNLPAKLSDKLLRAPFVWLHCGSVLLHRPYDGPYAVLRQGPCSFIRVGSRDEIVSVSRLKACTEADATPGSPRLHGQLPGKRPGGPATTKQVSFADPLVSPPSSPAPLRDFPETVFLPGEEVFARPGPVVPSQPPQTWYPSRQWVLPQRLDI